MRPRRCRQERTKHPRKCSGRASREDPRKRRSGGTGVGGVRESQEELCACRDHTIARVSKYNLGDRIADPLGRDCSRRVQEWERAGMGRLVRSVTLLTGLGEALAATSSSERATKGCVVRRAAACGARSVVICFSMKSVQDIGPRMRVLRLAGWGSQEDSEKRYQTSAHIGRTEAFRRAGRGAG